MARALPPSASVAQNGEGAKLFAPAAARNGAAIAALLVDHAPTSGSALEIASGTGQHVTAFATALPDLYWHPTEINTARCASINAYVTEAGLSNVAAAGMLNATQQGWSASLPANDMIVLVNLLHLISEAETRTLIAEAALALSPSGTLIFYGPFMRGGVLISDGDARFDAELRGADPAIGYKGDLDIADWLSDAGLIEIKTVEMPANNLAFIARKHAP